MKPDLKLNNKFKTMKIKKKNKNSNGKKENIK